MQFLINAPKINFIHILWGSLLMKPGLSSEKALGMASAASAYLMWGILPIYWKSIYFVPSSEILTHRVVWSFLFMVLVLLVTGKIRSFFSELYQVVSSPKQIIVLVLASFFISVNWLTFIWAVSNNRVIEGMKPLVLRHPVYRPF